VEFMDANGADTGARLEKPSSFILGKMSRQQRGTYNEHLEPKKEPTV
jgi:hypothetical protein